MGEQIIRKGSVMYEDITGESPKEIPRLRVAIKCLLGFGQILSLIVLALS